MGGGNTQFDWCRSEDGARRLARFFVEGLTESYISHSELQGPRAKSPTQWADDIDRVLEADLIGRVSNPLDAAAGEATMLAASLTVDSHLEGVFLVTFSRASRTPYAMLEDMVVAPSARGKGYGTKFLTWIDHECARRGIRRQFLESGAHNERAHRFFEEHQFKTVSIVMMKEL